MEAYSLPKKDVLSFEFPNNWRSNPPKIHKVSDGGFSLIIGSSDAAKLAFTVKGILLDSMGMPFCPKYNVILAQAFRIRQL